MAPQQPLRHYIDLVEGKQKPPPMMGDWPVNLTSPIFLKTVRDMQALYPDVLDRINRFVTVKKRDPLNTPYAKNDAPMSSQGPFAGLMHCHLAPDLIVLYSLKGRTLTLVALCQHADIEGKRAKSFAKRIV